METQKTSPYQPVSCDFIDVLETFSLQKRRIDIKVLLDDGTTAWYNGRVKDIFTRDHAEFVKLSDDVEIRLDRILETRPH